MPDRDSLERRYLDRSDSHAGTRDALRIIGPMVMVVGGLFMIVGIGSFFAAFGSFEPPRYFWCAFIGMPLLAVGGAITKFAYMGAVARYMSNEIAPVGKDVVNYMAVGTQEGVKTATKALAEGLREGLAGQPLIGIAPAPGSVGSGASTGTSVKCPKCGAANQPGSKYCDQCGAAMQVVCGGCGASNQPGSKFCDQCGQRLL